MTIQDVDNFRKAATELSDRIKMFEKWLGEQPARVLCSATEASSKFCVRYARSGKNWVLEFTDDGESWSLLRDASLDTKIRAVPLFKRLFSAMTKKREELAAALVDATAAFDSFAKEIKIDPEAHK
jgi:hypothetical protein